MELSDYLNGKKVVLLGFGREGRSSYRYLRKHFPQQRIIIADKNERLTDDSEFANDPLVDLHLGDSYLRGINDCDIILKSPGIARTLLPTEIKAEVSSQTDMFLRFYAPQTIGITGTKGKSTTTHLLFDILKRRFGNVIMAGNMGIPFFDIVEKIDEETLVVSELSSHQLEGITVAPHIGILLNMFEEHLDYYASYEEYKQAKMNIVRCQSAEDIFIYSLDNEDLKACVESFPVNSQRYAWSLEENVNAGCCFSNEWVVFRENNCTEKLYNTDSPRILKGKHNLSNIMSACLAARLLNVDAEVLSTGIGEFKGLEHRLEFVGTFEDISFYNDSISTIPQAAIEAVKALQLVDTLILGGFDRGIDYQPLYDMLKDTSVHNLVFVGEAGRRMYNELSQQTKITQNILLENDYRTIVEWCFRYTAKGRICLLSPAASSYDAFKNFEERGTCFKKLVKEHQTI